MQPWIPHDLLLSGTHVVLEPMQASHTEALAQAAADGELWTLEFTSVPRAQDMGDMVEAALANRASGTELPFIVRRISDNTIVGATRYYWLAPEHRNLSIGYTWYSKSVHRTAVNTECKFLLLRYAFETLNCISVAWHTDDQNQNSQRAIERLGAKFEGVLRNHKIMPDGRRRHTHCYSMLDIEWPASKTFLSQQLARSE